MNFNYIGRFFFEDGVASFSWSSSRIEMMFTGRELVLDIESAGEEIFYNLYLNGEFHSVFSVLKGRHSMKVLNDLEYSTYKVAIERRNELFFGLSKFYGVREGSLCKMEPLSPEKRLYIEFIGDSLTAGYGAESKAIDEPFSGATENSSKSYAGVAASILNADYSTIAYSGKGAYRDYAGSIEKNLPYYYPLINEFPKVNWNFSKVPDLVVINLGANDFAVDIPEQELFIGSYLSIIDKIIDGYGKVPILLVGGMEQKSENISTNREYIEEIYKKSKDRGIDAYKLFMPPKSSEITRGADDHPSYKQNLIYGKIVAKEVKELNI